MLEVEGALRKAGYTVRASRFTPFDQAAAAQGPALRDLQPDSRQPARRGHRRGASRPSPAPILVAAGDAALAGALASAIEPPRLAILDVGGFDTGRDEDYLAHLYIPGLRRAGDVQTASEMAPGRLVIHNAGPRIHGFRRTRAAGAPGAGRNRGVGEAGRRQSAALTLRICAGQRPGLYFDTRFSSATVRRSSFERSPGKWAVKARLRAL